jgi:hypothetical protein
MNTEYSSRRAALLSDERLRRVADVLAAFQALPPPQPPAPTLFEIAGRPHLESVASNVLAFYFQPDIPHGLGSLVLNALLYEAGLLDGDFRPPDVRDEKEGSVTVERELVTTSGKRIDIVVTTSDLAVGVENKVFHHLHNDLDDYHRFLARKYDGLPVSVVVLALRPPASLLNERFPIVLYRDLFRRVEAGLDHHGPASDPRYRIYLEDFIETMSHLDRDEAVQRDLIAFMATKKKAVEDVLRHVGRVQESIKARLANVEREISVPNGFGVRRVGYSNDPVSLGRFLYVDFVPAPGVRLAVDIYLGPEGWELSMNAKRDVAAVVRWLEESGIDAYPHPTASASPSASAHSPPSLRNWAAST